MDVGTVGWIALGWISAALVISLVLGSFLRKASEATGEEDFAVTAPEPQVVRFLRGRKTANAQATVVAPRLREAGKRAAS